MNPKFQMGFLLLVVIGATAQRAFLQKNGINNFVIFQYSFSNLVNGVDMYAAHPDQYYDLYKYSPTFAALMFPFWLMRASVGIFFWNLLNALAPFWVVRKLNLSEKQKAFVFFFTVLEILTSVQSSQSNGLMAALMLGSFLMFEKEKPIMAALFICLGFYIKLFALGAAAMMLFYPKKLQFILAMIFWGIVLACLPLLVTDFSSLMTQYQSWLHLLANDPSHELNFSIMTITERFWGVAPKDSWYLIPGFILLVLPLARITYWSNRAFQLLWLSSLMIWVVIFNHKAESPTFAVAVIGVALWALTEKPSWIKTSLLIFVFVLTVLSLTDFVPPWVREHVVKAYALKVLPCIVVWFYMTWRLLRGKEFTMIDFQQPRV
ncbi:MAG: glycosyltransferase family 87 protein [Bacteroidia bacterium]